MIAETEGFIEAALAAEALCTDLHGALRSWASGNIRCDFLVYPVDRRNTPSRMVAERLGGVIHAERSIRNMSGRVLAEVVYRLQPDVVSGS